MIADPTLNGTHNPQSSPETPAPSSFLHDTIQDLAMKAKDALPRCGERVDKAVDIVLDDDVILLSDGRAVVGSQSDCGVHYIVDGSCSCSDADSAPDGWCKHRRAL